MADKLTIKQERFCQKYIECGNASEAYRFAYDSDNMSTKTIGRKAKELLDNGKITAWLDISQSKTAEKHEITKDTHIKNLQELKRMAIETGNLHVAVKAENLIGQTCGLYTQKHEHSGTIVDKINVVIAPPEGE